MGKQIKSAVYIAVAALVLIGVPRAAQASGPMSVYARVDKVDLEPGSDHADRIRITGVFIVATDNAGGTYSAPQTGYLYFALPASNRDLALREWSDLKSVAGTKQIVGFGSAWFSQVHVRSAGEKAAAEDYPMGNGLARINADQPRARALLDEKSPGR